MILGIDFLQQNELVLDFTSIPVGVFHSGSKLNCSQQIEAMWHSEKDAKSKQRAVAVVNDANFNMVDECSVPKCGDPLQFDLQTC